MIIIDYETRSKLEVKNVGSYRYAERATPIMFAAHSLIHGEHDDIKLWVAPEYRQLVTHQSAEAMRLLTSGKVKAAFNAEFEYCITKSLGIQTTIDEWICIAALARSQGWPNSLEKVAIAMELTNQKDRRGKNLLRKFCLPNKEGQFNDPFDYPKEFVELCEYCIQDIRTEIEVYANLTHNMRAVKRWRATAKLNEAGIPINRKAIKHTLTLLDRERDELTDDFLIWTGGIKPTQTKALQQWAKENGYPYANLQDKTVREYLKDNPCSKVATVLSLRSKLSFAATKKLPKLLACQCSDGLVRGQHIWHQAHTGRAAGTLAQPQNFKRPVKGSMQAFDLLAMGVEYDHFKLNCGDVHEKTASCIRHFIESNQPFLDIDYVAIECRLACWLAGLHNVLRMFKEGRDVYVEMASRIFQKPFDRITSEERFIGKQTVLGCIYGMSANRFVAQCEGYGVTVTIELAERAVSTLRKEWKEIPAMWRKVESAVKLCILKPTVPHNANELSFVMNIDGILFMRLPSGDRIWYRGIRYTEEDGLYFQGVGKSGDFVKTHTYGAKIFENASQAMCGVLLDDAIITAQKLGAQPFMEVHDQLLIRPELTTPNELMSALSETPKYLSGFPLKLDSHMVRHYTKS